MLWGYWSFGQKMARYGEHDVLDCISLVSAREQAGDDEAAMAAWFAERGGMAGISPLAFELEREWDPVMGTAFALYFDLFGREIDLDAASRWMAAPTAGGEFIILPRETSEADVAEQLPSVIELNVSRILANAWARLEHFNLTNQSGGATPGWS